MTTSNVWCMHNKYIYLNGAIFDVHVYVCVYIIYWNNKKNTRITYFLKWTNNYNKAHMILTLSHSSEDFYFPAANGQSEFNKNNMLPFTISYILNLAQNPFWSQYTDSYNLMKSLLIFTFRWHYRVVTS